MWKYKNITRELFELKKNLAEDLLKEMGATPLQLFFPHYVTHCVIDKSDKVLMNRPIFKLQDNYYRVNEVLFPAKPYIVIEWANNIEDVQNNTMEDLDPFPFDLSHCEMKKEIQTIING